MFVLRAFVNERLTTAVEEILGAVEHTVADYQNEVSRLEKEVGCLRQQLDTLQPVIKIPRADIQQVTVQVSEEKIAPEWHHCQQGIQPNNPSLDWRDPEPIPSKEELKDIETTEQQVDPEPTCIKEEEEHLNISEGLEGHDVMQHAQHPDPDFYPALSPDCATPPRGSNDFSVEQRQYRARRNADPIRRQKYLERSAESQRQYRARRNIDPVRRQKYLEREKERWREDRRTGKRKLIGELSEREQRHKREEWRAARLRSRAKAAAACLTITQAASPDLVPQARHQKLVETSCNTYTSASVVDAVDPGNPWLNLLCVNPVTWGNAEH